MRSFTTLTLLVLAASASAGGLRSTHRLQARVGAPFKTDELDAAVNEKVGGVNKWWKTEDDNILSMDDRKGAEIVELSAKKTAAAFVDSLKAEVSDLEANILRVQGTLNGLRASKRDMDQVDKDNQAMEENRKRLHSELGEAEAASAKVNDKIASAVDAQERIEMECEAADESMKKLKTEREALEKKIAGSIAERKALQAKVGEKRKELEEKEKELSASNKKLGEEKELLATALQTAAQAAVMMSTLNSELDRLSTELEAARKRGDELASSFIEVSAIDDANICGPKFPYIAGVLCKDGKVDLADYEDIADTADAVVEMLTETEPAHAATMEKFKGILAWLAQLKEEMKNVGSTDDLQKLAQDLTSKKLELLKTYEVVENQVRVTSEELKKQTAEVEARKASIQLVLSEVQAALDAVLQKQKEAELELEVLLAKTAQMTEKCNLKEAQLYLSRRAMQDLEVVQEEERAASNALVSEQQDIAEKFEAATDDANAALADLDSTKKELDVALNTAAELSGLKKSVAKKQIQVDGAKATVEKLEALQ